MASSWVVKFAAAESSGDAVLINVSTKKYDSLDLDLLATDGNSAFKGKGKTNAESIHVIILMKNSAREKFCEAEGKKL